MSRFWILNLSAIHPPKIFDAVTIQPASKMPIINTAHGSVFLFAIEFHGRFLELSSSTKAVKELHILTWSHHRTKFCDPNIHEDDFRLIIIDHRPLLKFVKIHCVPFIWHCASIYFIFFAVHTTKSTWLLASQISNKNENKHACRSILGFKWTPIIFII